MVVWKPDKKCLFYGQNVWYLNGSLKSDVTKKCLKSQMFGFQVFSIQMVTVRAGEYNCIHTLRLPKCIKKLKSWLLFTSFFFLLLSFFCSDFRLVVLVQSYFSWTCSFSFAELSSFDFSASCSNSSATTTEYHSLTWKKSTYVCQITLNPSLLSTVEIWIPAIWIQKH